MLCDIKGAGIINHIWITIAPPLINRNDIIFRIYWDDNTFPSVESPIGPFFGQGWNEAYTYNTLPLVAGPIEGRALVSYFKMPFAKGARIEVENQTGSNIEAFYYYVDYVEMEKPTENMAYFHAWYNHQLTATRPEGENEWEFLAPNSGAVPNLKGEDNYIILDVKGKGHYVGVNYYVNNPTPVWYGEGDDMIFIDGDKMPTLKGTGTEDYFNTSWCPKEPFSHPYFGYPRVNNNIGWLGRTHVYRFHIEDPIYFDKSIKFTIEHGHNNYLPLDLASVAYWYADKPTQIPAIPGRADRIPQPAIDFGEIHRWRDAWRKEKGYDPLLWGNEISIVKNPIKDWMIIGPFDNPKGINGFNDVFPPEKELDMNAVYEGKNSQNIKWQQFSIIKGGLMNFNQIFSNQDYAVAYGLSYVWSPDDFTTKLKVGSDDGIKVWINKTNVLEVKMKRGAFPDTDIAEITLKKGWNEVLVKNVEDVGEWGFYLQFEDLDNKLKYSTVKK